MQNQAQQVTGGQISGALTMVGEPSPVLAQAIRFIGRNLHAAINNPASTRGCVFCALITRDFFKAIGFEDARVASVVTAFGTGTSGQIELVGTVGAPRPNTAAYHWAGHLVTAVSGYLVDTTLFENVPKGWQGPSGILAVPLNRPPLPQDLGRPTIARLIASRGGRTSVISWMDADSNLGWVDSADARNDGARQKVVRKLLDLRGR